VYSSRDMAKFDFQFSPPFFSIIFDLHPNEISSL
jgi:hypothetical protein